MGDPEGSGYSIRDGSSDYRGITQHENLTLSSRTPLTWSVAASWPSQATEREKYYTHKCVEWCNSIKKDTLYAWVCPCHVYAYGNAMIPQGLATTSHVTLGASFREGACLPRTNASTIIQCTNQINCFWTFLIHTWTISVILPLNL